MLLRLMFKVSLAIWILGAGLCIYWLWFDHPKVFLQKSATILHDGPIHPGDTIVIDRDFCQLMMPIAHSAQRWISNTFTSYLTDHDIAGNIGCTHRQYWFELPLTTMPGEHEYHLSVNYQINPFRSLVVEWPPLKFDVVLKDAK